MIMKECGDGYFPVDLNDLYEALVAEACTEFYIDGVGGDSHGAGCMHLSYENDNWIMWYQEPGRWVSHTPIWSCKGKPEALKQFYDYIRNQHNWHLIVFTRKKADCMKCEKFLNAKGIKTIRNDIPAFKLKNDYVYRLFVRGKDINRVKDVLIDTRLFNGVKEYLDSDAARIQRIPK